MNGGEKQRTRNRVGKEKIMTDTGERGGFRQRIVDDYAGRKLYDERGEKVGKVEYTVLDSEGRPEYLAVKTGWFGSNTTLIPESLLRPGDRDDEFEVQASEDKIKDAPTFDNEDDVNRDFEDRVRDYFGIGGAAGSSVASSETSDRDTGYSGESRESGEYRGESRSEGEPRDDRRDSSDAAAVGGAASGGMDRDTDRGGYREDERRDDRASGSSRSGEREKVRVTVKRERARAERVIGEDGKEEVRIRKETIEEEEMVEVEDRL
jgi:sporulation protein YlmC with PRC-barrel domain